MAGIGVVESERTAEGDRLEESQGAGSSERDAGARDSGVGALGSALSECGERSVEQHAIPKAVVGSAADSSLAGVESEQDGIVIPVDVHESGIVHGVVVPPGASSFQRSENRSEHGLPPSSSGVEEDEEDVIRIDDDEIEMAGPQGFRAGVAQERLFDTDRLSSVPPLRPSLRAARFAGRASLPPPRRSRLPSPPTTSPPASRIGVEASAAAWLEANHRLAMARTLAKNEALEKQLRSQSRELLDVEGRLGRALRRVAILEAELTAARLQLQAADAQGSSRASVNDASDRGVSPALSAEHAEPSDPKHSAATERSSINPAATSSTTGEPPPSGAVRDMGELRAIEGIGPKLEAGLHRVGITRLAQIAEWSDADVRRFAKRMKISRSRIVKGQWVERAAEAVRRASQCKS